MASIPQLPAALDRWQQTLNWQPTAQQQALFQQLYEQICLGNQRLNLTRLTEPSDFWEKHLWDSLSGIAPWLNPNQTAPSPVQTVIDIGTGGGFPGLPVAIAQPAWQVTLLDATRKKIQFLETVSQTLGLERVQGLAERAETVGQRADYRDLYDLALVRAVGSASTCAEYALPLLRLGGYAVLFRGQWTEAEGQALAAALIQLGGTQTALRSWSTPLTQSQRHCLLIQKTAATAETFPRAVGIPAKAPL
ncbi:16S rRNA (guanine(527)-N(7))-methyltransferase RsmG [Romeria aff. gracilis LEGE 07310]|uniref:Ribosomal RNA small subunit methyltransferase G n=1 Tax=Vasconcelosia minhoensis LEGE 07310 TaxID=915328 RepID=A0A8J7DSD2_9CYAN|nr:16S rRNA (guanine(527)-N(7))-methyltransferase RsmG [Romeria gracilis]MBE9080059.1 16S rRNA (guanine(527)-N(7))-methyltransferase RsmG [Romeria aff. gracilis LEGE 07310]